MKRLLDYLKPYKVFVVLALAALAVSTVSELLAPIVLKTALDREILVRYTRIAQTPHNSEIISQLRKKNKKAVYAEGYYYFYQDAAGKLPAADRALFDDTEWYVAPADKSLKNIIDSRFIVTESHVIIEREKLSEFSPEELSVLRKSNTNNVLRLGIIYLLLLAGSLSFSFVQVYLMAAAGQKVMKDIRLELFRHIISQSLSYLGRTPVGTLVTRLTNDVETINEFFTSVSTSILKDAAVMAGVLVILFVLDFRLALITTASFPPILFATLFFRKKARDAYRQVRVCVSRINTFLSEHISGMDVVQMFGREKKSREEFNKYSDNLLNANLTEMYVFASFRPLVNMFTSISIAVIIYFGAGMIFDYRLSIGVLIAYINLTSMFYRPVMNISEQFTVLQSAMAGGERIFTMLDRDDRIADNGTTPLPDHVSGGIEFRNVCFSYKEGEPVIKNLSFKINPGETAAIAGYTGAGKTTIAALLTRLWDVEAGEILLDGIDIRNIKLDKLRRTIQQVQQDVFLFSGTIEDNIKFGSDFSCSEIIKAAKLVQADSFIKRIPGGYSAVISERGSNLSTGERQLLSFSRVVAHNPRVIILDEATGSIDTETERLIQKGIKSLMKGRTSLVIAHRLSTIRHADRILVLSSGKLAEEGTHDELIARKKIYYNLYKLQFEKS